MSSSSKRKLPANQSTSSSVTGGETSKRTRLQDQSNNDEDTVGDLDIEEQDRKRLQQGRKGRVVTDGYDSEGSSEEDEEEDGEEKDKKIVEDEEDEDMFNPNENGQEKPTLKGEGKKKYLDLDDIEGQEFSDEEGAGEKEDAELELEEDEEQEGGNEVKSIKSRNGRDSEGDGRMGFKMESFNMKNEMATGRFDEEGNYIANAKDPHAEHDKWLAGNYSRKNIAAAKEAQEKRLKETENKEKNRENAQLDEDECKMELVVFLRRGESVLSALQRLGGMQKKLKGIKQKEGKANGHSDQVEKNEEIAKVKNELDKITSLASELMSRYGLVNIYDATYEGLLSDVRKSGLVRSTWDPAADKGNEKDAHNSSSSYMYKWSPTYLQTMSQSPQSEQETFGPFEAKELRSWKESGYFGDSGERILLKSDGEDKNVWSSWKDIFG